MVLQITDNAAAWMRRALAEEDDSRCFRIIVTARGVQLLRGKEGAGDVVIYAHGSRAVLVLDAATADFLTDCGVDYDRAAAKLVASPCVQAAETSRSARFIIAR
jgi:Fe-S cluster assembly iron-binding protein IscA